MRAFTHATAHVRSGPSAATHHSFPTRAQGDIPSIKSLIVLDSDGKRIVARYYKNEFATLAEVRRAAARQPARSTRSQTSCWRPPARRLRMLPTPRPPPVQEHAFEKKLSEKTIRTNAKSEAEIIMFDNMVTVYRNSADVWFFVVGHQAENELILVSALGALVEALTSVLRTTPDKRSLMDNFDTLLLAVDELIDGGMILETDPTTIVNRVGMKGSDGAVTGVEAAFTEQSFNTMFASAREQLARSLLK